jgi:hypothetical protein
MKRSRIFEVDGQRRGPPTTRQPTLFDNFLVVQDAFVATKKTDTICDVTSATAANAAASAVAADADAAAAAATVPCASQQAWRLVTLAAATADDSSL